MRLATWNVNSIRMRVERITAFLERQRIDVACLQETKARDDEFPREAFEELGYHLCIHGQRTYNGVAILSRSPIEEPVLGIPDGEDDPEARFLSARIGRLRLANVYVPNGSVVGSDKFSYKLRWLARLQQWIADTLTEGELFLVCGDYNIAPDDRDVYDPDSWRGKVLFHPDEHKALAELGELGLRDGFRQFHEEGGLYSWWDYRAGMFHRGKGLRIDHVFVTEALAERAVGMEIDRDERKGKKPSDHAPVIAEFRL
jgi:exodeoxyribonuclease-3